MKHYSPSNFRSFTSRSLCAVPGFVLAAISILPGIASAKSVALKPDAQTAPQTDQIVSTPPAAAPSSTYVNPLLRITKIGAGILKNPRSLRATPSGDLIVLDQRENGRNVVIKFGRDGSKLREVLLPAELRFPNLALVDSFETLYFTVRDTTEVWMLTSNNGLRSFDAGLHVNGATIKKTGEGEFLYVLGRRGENAARFSLPNLSRNAIVLSTYPDSSLTDLQVRADGHLYAYCWGERNVWHFDARGQWIDKMGGGTSSPSRNRVAGDHINNYFDVAANGDVFWSLGDYGALFNLKADGKSGSAYTGLENGRVQWVGPYFSLTGVALAGDFAYVIDRSYKRITGFPISLLNPGTRNVETIEPRAFGLGYKLVTPAPYKLFTGDTANFTIALDRGNRSVRLAKLKYSMQNLGHETVARGEIEVPLPGNGEMEVALPPFRLPKMGWYQLETSIGDASSNLVERVTFLSRVAADDSLPIPARESSGWNDIATHKMIGMGLHRFAGSMNQLLGNEVRNAMALAKQMNVPYFMQISDKSESTPDNVRRLLQAYPDLPMLEIMNEPNTQGVNAESYLNNYLKPCHSAARQISADVRLMGPDIVGIDLGWINKFLTLGGGQYIDILSIHSYERHNSMDTYHWNWKLSALRDLMRKHNFNKPLYQSEHGFMGDYKGGAVVRPEWQARSLFLEVEALNRAGIDANSNYYYYVNKGGYDYSSYLVDASRELLPAATLLRTRAQMLKGRSFDAAVDLGAPGNWLVSANRYRGANTDAIIFINNGALEAVPVKLNLPTGSRVFDSFANAQEVGTGAVTLAIGRFPTYLEVPRGALVTPAMPSFGRNIAPEAKVLVDDPLGKETASRLNNNILEFDFVNALGTKQFQTSDNKMPMDVTLQFDRPRKINSAVLYSSFADNDHCTPLKYQVSVRVNGQWQLVDDVVQTPAFRTLVRGNISRLQGYDNPWIFVHNFEPRSADAVKFHFTETTRGFYPTRQAAIEIDGGTSYIRPMRVELREAQVFEVAGDEPEAPVAVSQAVTLDENTSKAITLEANAPDADDLNYNVVDSADHGTLSGSGANRTYTPKAGFVGNDSFSFKVSDGNAESAPAVVSITVKDVVPPTTPSEVILDNTNTARVSFTGAWTTSTVTRGYLGSNYRHDQNKSKGAKSARFTPDLTGAGSYKVYLRWTSSRDRASNLPVDIRHKSGTSTVTVNQRTNGGKWVLLGTYAFNAGTGGNVLLRTTGTNSFVIADAVRFVPVP